MSARTVSLAIVALVALAGLASVIVPRLEDKPDATSSYCATLSAKQSQLGGILQSGDPTALVDNVALFKTVATDAPSDISGSWTALISAVQSLQSAIAASGHKPSDFAGGRFPSGLSAAQRQAITSAADTLSSPTTVAASSAIDQEVRDVCRLDLGM